MAIPSAPAINAAPPVVGAPAPAAAPAVAAAPAAPAAAPAVAAAPAAPAAPAVAPAAQPAAPSIPPAPSMTTAPTMPAMPPQVAAAPPTQLAPVEQPQALAQAQQTQVALGADGFPIGSLEQIAAAMGFEGLDFDAFGIVPNVSLDKGVFKLSDGSVLGEEFYAILGNQRNKYLFSYTYLPEGKAMAATSMVTEVLYSYDQVNGASGHKTVDQLRQEAAKVGSEVEMKVYHEVSATLQDGRIVNLSIPKAGSGTALTRFIVSCVAAKKLPSKVWARVYKGKEVDGPKIKHAFVPWAIDIHGDVV